MMDERRTALITGASSGIGKALAHTFARNGFNIIGVASDKARLDAAMDELRSMHDGLITSITKDLMQPGAAQEIYETLAQRGTRIDVLVNDAGEGQGGPFHESPLERDLDLIRLNVEAVTALTKLFLRDMLLRNEGRILNVGSVAGFQPGPLQAVYHATKAYVNSFTEALAEELKDSKVTVTLLCPGPTDTNFFETAGLEHSRIHESGALMDPARVADIGFDALMDGERIVITGWSNKVMTFTRRLVPRSMQAKVNKKMYEVKEED